MSRTTQLFTVEVEVDPDSRFSAEEVSDALRFQRAGLQSITVREEFALTEEDKP